MRIFNWFLKEMGSAYGNNISPLFRNICAMKEMAFQKSQKFSTEIKENNFWSSINSDWFIVAFKVSGNNTLLHFLQKIK